MTDFFITKCIICGEPADIMAMCVYTGDYRCGSTECQEKARVYAETKDRIMQEYAEEKERLLRPWQEKLTADLFLLKREYFYNYK